MKQTFRTVALLAVLGLTAVSCQKETLVDNHNPEVSYAKTSYTVSYTVDGVTTQVTLVGETAWSSFLDWLFALAEEGHSVSFFIDGQEQSISREVVTYSTQDYDDAKAWAESMSKKGYVVSIDFDKTTLTYICTAVK